jgi:hypothetical protein
VRFCHPRRAIALTAPRTIRGHGVAGKSPRNIKCWSRIAGRLMHGIRFRSPEERRNRLPSRWSRPAASAWLTMANQTTSRSVARREVASIAPLRPGCTHGLPLTPRPSSRGPRFLDRRLRRGIPALQRRTRPKIDRRRFRCRKVSVFGVIRNSSHRSRVANSAP